jgi:predicted Zn-dependent protease
VISLIGEDVNVVALPPVSSAIIHEAIGHLVEADVWETIRSVDNKNQLNTDKTMSISDQPMSVKGSLIYGLDEEGNDCQETVIIKNGVFIGLLADNYYSNRLDQYPKGNCRSYHNQDYSFIRMSNLVMENGELDKYKVINNYKACLVATEIHNSEMDFNGHVKIWCRDTIVINHFKPIGVMKLTRLNSLYGPLISSITNLCDDGVWSSEIWCTKHNNKVPIGTFSPTFSCKMNLR